MMVAFHRGPLLKTLIRIALMLGLIAVLRIVFATPEPSGRNLPSGQLLLPVPGDPQPTNNWPTVLAVSPDQNYVAILSSGYGTYSSGQQQSIAILDVANNHLTDVPEPLMTNGAAQTFFHGMAFSSDGHKIYASVGSITDPLGQKKRNVGDGILVYNFENGKPAQGGFLKMPPRSPADARQRQRPDMRNVTFPSGLAVVRGKSGDSLLVANNLSDEAVLMDTTGAVQKRFDLSLWPRLPSSFPF